MLLKKAQDLKKWEEIRISKAYEGFRKVMKDFYEEMDGDISVLQFWDFTDYFRTGTRLTFEKKYFHRRGQLLAAAGMYLLEKKQTYLERLENIIWAICDEYTWALPAHILSQQNTEKARVYIDLFAGETVFALSEISCLLGDDLHPWVQNRIKNEAERRIIKPYENGNFFWENVEMNWAAVCAGSVGACYLYLFPERFPRVKERILNTMNCFLQGFGADGCCREGMSYWNYGFGFFTYFADLLFQFTEGRENLFEDARAEAAAQFPQAAFLNPATVISFADCGPDSKIEPGIASYLAGRYPGKVVVTGLSADILDRNDRCYRWTAFIRNLLWGDFEIMKPKQPEQFRFLPEAQWYVNHRGAFVLAAKGGHNDEPHNHNDLGEIILADEAEQLLCDLGSGLYTHAYFQPETRYDVASNASCGHSVPIIDGTLQAPGAACCANTLRADSDVFAVDIAGAYKLPALLSAVRELTVKPDIITLCDRFSFSGGTHKITERFITKIKPVCKDGAVCIKALKLDCGIEPEVSQGIFTDHFGKEHIYYMLDYSVSGEAAFCMEFTRI